MEKTQTTNKIQTMSEFPKVLADILEELRLLRNEVMLLFPQESLEDYAHTDRIKNSYHKAIQEYPPISFQYGNNQD